jgi:hypothetical protein
VILCGAHLAFSSRAVTAIRALKAANPEAFAVARAEWDNMCAAAARVLLTATDRLEFHQGRAHALQEFKTALDQALD